MARKSIGGNGTSPLVASGTAVPANKSNATPAGLKGSKAGKPRKSKGGKRTLKTLGGTSGIMNPPLQGGYNG